MEIQIGHGSIQNTSLNPYASIRYQMKAPAKTRHRLSSELGDIYGESVWGLTEIVSESSFHKAYVRQHRASGQYPVYSNSSTPLNLRDDKIVSQSNNDQSSLQGMVFSEWDHGQHSWSLLARDFKKSNGFAPYNPDLDAEARGVSFFIASGSLSIRRSRHLPFYMTAGWRRDQQETYDPQREILGSFTELERQNQSREYAVEAFLNGWMSWKQAAPRTKVCRHTCQRGRKLYF